jgi:hypothetical protein
MVSVQCGEIEKKITVVVPTEKFVRRAMMEGLMQLANSSMEIISEKMGADTQWRIIIFFLCHCVNLLSNL